MKIEKLNRFHLLRFHALMMAELGIKYVGDPGIIQKLVRRLLDRICGKLRSLVPREVFRLRPMTLKNIIFLPYLPGDPSVSAIKQIRIAIHEAAHALRIRASDKRAAPWYSEYFRNPDNRAEEEAVAQLAEAEFLYWYTGTLPQLVLDGYAVPQSSIEYARKDYDKHIKLLTQMGRGHGVLEVSATAIQILKKDLDIEPI